MFIGPPREYASSLEDVGAGENRSRNFRPYIAAELRGEVVVKANQLAMEFDPQPPFQTGPPKNAGPKLIKVVDEMLHGSPKNSVEAVRRVRDSRPTGV